VEHDSQQAGENYRYAFHGFDPEKIARYDARKIASLMKDAGIIRNRQKIAAAVKNARAFLRVQEEFGSFNAYSWRFVGGKPRINHRRALHALTGEHGGSRRPSART